MEQHDARERTGLSSNGFTNLILSKFRSSKFRPALIAILISLAYYLGAKLGLALTSEAHAVSTLWPPNSILLAALLLTSKRWWWFILAAVLPAHLLAELGSGVPLPMVLCWFVSNSCEALLGAYLIRRFSDAPTRFDSIQSVAVFLSVALLAPFASSFLDAAFVKLNAWGSGTYWQVWRMRFSSNVLAELTVVPVIVLWTTAGTAALRRILTLRGLEALALSVVLLTVSITALGGYGDGNMPEVLYAPLPVLLWAAVRFGPKGFNTSLLIVTLLAIWSAVQGRGPFSTHTPEANAFSIQLFLILIGAPLMFLAALLRELASAREAAGENAEQLALALSAAEMRNRQVRLLAGRLITAQEAERRRISHELHDDFSQKLATFSMSLSRLKRRLTSANDPMAAELKDLYNRANELNDDLRHLSHELHPTTLEHLGLADALAAYVAEFRTTEETDVSFTARVDNRVRIPFEISICVYRIALEALRNIAKHSYAKSASVSLTEDAEILMLEVADRGVGFDVEAAKRGGGIGLLSAAERVHLLQGSFEIVSRPNHGAKLTARIPLR